jgi:hypothetical protein
MFYKDQREIIGLLMEKLARYYACTNAAEIRAVLRELLTALARRLSDVEKQRVYH